MESRSAAPRREPGRAGLRYRVEADLARLALGVEGIDAVIFDAEANSLFGGGGLIGSGYEIDEDFDQAAEILLEEPS